MNQQELEQRLREIWSIRDIAIENAESTARIEAADVLRQYSKASKPQPVPMPGDGDVLDLDKRR